MSRRRAAEKRPILPDAKFGDPVITKFINCLMMQGKKSAAERIVYSALDTIGQRSGADPLKMFHDALEDIVIGNLVFVIEPALYRQLGTELVQQRVSVRLAVGPP